MKTWKSALRLYVVAWAVFLGLALSTASNATTVYDLRGGGDPAAEIGSGFGNMLDFGDFTVTAWGATDGSSNLLDTAEVERWSTGLGSCNQQEGTDCSSPAHQVDNFGPDDYILFTFDQLVTFDSIEIDPWGTWDRDVTYWIADISLPPTVLGLDPVDLNNGSTAFGAATSVNNSESSAPVTISLGGGVGNVLLFAANTISDQDDRFKIATLTTSPIPVPPAVWLFGSGLIGLVGIARRKRAS